MGKWIKKILSQEISASYDKRVGDLPHIPLEDIAAMVDGRKDQINPEKRKEYILHLDVCQECYELLSETMSDLKNVDLREQIKPGRPHKQFYTLAASIVIMIMVSGMFFFNHTRSGFILTASIPMDQSISQILLENNSHTWTGNNRIKRFENLLKSRNINIKTLEKVILKNPYTQSKSLFKPREILKIRIKGNVAYIEVVEE